MNLRLAKILIYFVISITALVCIIPFGLIVMGSIMNEKEIIMEGFKLIPEKLDFKAYQIVFTSGDVILNGYKISTIVTLTGTFLSLLICTMCAYPISKRKLKYRNIIAFYIFFTMLFNGGMVPWYITCVRYLHLKDSILALIIPYLGNAFNILLVRNYFKSIPDEISESAFIDGAGEFRIFIEIVLPLSVPVIATVSLFTILTYWNDWWLGIMFIDSPEKMPLQIMLRSIVSRVEFLRQTHNAAALDEMVKNLPSESVKLATVVVTTGPIILIYPFIQRYFIKGIMIGAVKG